MSYQDFQALLSDRTTYSRPSLRCDTHTILKEDVIEYFGGVFVAQCAICEERIELDRIPGGPLVSRAKSLLKIVRAGNAESIHRMELSVLKSFLKSDIQAVRETANILEQIEEEL
jgi:hypothetical protein